MIKNRTEMKQKILYGIKNITNLYVSLLGVCVDTGFNSYELGEKFFYDNEAKNFWNIGNLYKLKNDIKMNLFQSLFESEIKYPEIFQICDFKIFKEKSTLEKFLEQNYSKKTFLKNEKYFIVLEKQYFSFGNCILQILLEDKIYLLNLSKDQSKKPWRYFENENL